MLRGRGDYVGYKAGRWPGAGEEVTRHHAVAVTDDASDGSLLAVLTCREMRLSVSALIV